MNWVKWRMRHLDLIGALLRESIEQLDSAGYTKGNETLLQAVSVLVSIVRAADAQALEWADTAREEAAAFGSATRGSKERAQGAPETPRLHEADGAVHEGPGGP